MAAVLQSLYNFLRSRHKLWTLFTIVITPTTLYWMTTILLQWKGSKKCECGMASNGMMFHWLKINVGGEGGEGLGTYGHAIIAYLALYKTRSERCSSYPSAQFSQTLFASWHSKFTIECMYISCISKIHYNSYFAITLVTIAILILLVNIFLMIKAFQQWCSHLMHLPHCYYSLEITSEILSEFVQ